MGAFDWLLAATGPVGAAYVSQKGSDEASDATRAAGEATLTAAREQMAFAEKWANIQMEERRRVEQQGVQLGIEYGRKKPEELIAISKIVQTKEQGTAASLAALEKEYQIYDQMSATVKEAGKQQLQLLRGESSKLLGPVLAQRDKQRLQLEGQLASKLGPGFRTSSAGIEALSKFDQGTTLLTAQVQTEALNQVTNVMTAAAGARPNIVGQNLSIFQQAGAMDQAVVAAEQNASARLMSGVMSGFRQTPIDLGGLWQGSDNIVKSSGLPFAGDIMSGQNAQNMGNTMLMIPTQIAGAAVGGAMSGRQVSTGVQDGSSPATFNEINSIAPASNTLFDKRTYA